MKTRILRPIVTLALLAGIGVVVMLLWNAIIPSVIGWGVLNYLQAVGLLALCRLMFGNFSGMRSRAGIAMVGNRDGLREQLKGMSREQRFEHIRSYYMKNEQ